VKRRVSSRQNGATIPISELIPNIVFATPGINSGVTISAIPDGIGYSYRLEIVVLITPGINSGVTISAIPDGIGYPYGLEIVVLMTPGINSGVTISAIPDGIGMLIFLIFYL